MGAWDELDTEISVEVETDELDTAIDLCDEYFTEEIKDYLVNIKEGVDEGSKQGVQDIAVKNRSFQQQALQKCKNPSGILSSSIIEEQQDEYNWIIGTIITHFYPLCVEFGRGEVYPLPPNKRLRFYGEDGFLIYPLMSKKAEPVPFVAPAYEKTDNLAEELMLRYIGRNLK